MDVASGALVAKRIDEDERDRRYFLERAEAELELAQRSLVPEAVRVHYELAGQYLDLVYNEEAFAQWKDPERPRPFVETAPAGSSSR